MLVNLNQSIRRSQNPAFLRGDILVRSSVHLGLSSFCVGMLDPLALGSPYRSVHSGLLVYVYAGLPGHARRGRGDQVSAQAASLLTYQSILISLHYAVSQKIVIFVERRSSEKSRLIAHLIVFLC